MPMTTQILTAVKKAYETAGRRGLDVFAIASGEVTRRACRRVIPPCDRRRRV